MDDTQFIRALRSALNNLYEPDQLRNNPLVGVLGLEGRIDAPAALQESIIDAIDAIRESGDEANFARAWLAYDVLHFRYVRGYGREEVAHKLNISDRQFSREVRTAIETLAAIVWRKHRPATGAEPRAFSGQMRDDMAPDDTVRDDSTAGELSSSDATALDERSGGAGATWLEDMPEESPSGWRETLESVLALLQPVMAQHDTRLQIAVGHALPDLLVAQNTLRQSLLVLLGWLIPAASGATILLKPDVGDGKLVLLWEVTVPFAQHAHLRESAETAMAIPRQLLDHRGGALEVAVESSGAETATFAILLTIPALAQVPILVIDDNLDTIQLFQRYVQGTRYALVGVSNPEDLSRVLERIQPRIILLDVMMPEIDGWDMLARLRQLPNAGSRAIVVCSIMPLESVARSLGANGFLQKPLLRHQLLQMLDTQMEALGS